MDSHHVPQGLTCYDHGIRVGDVGQERFGRLADLFEKLPRENIRMSKWFQMDKIHLTATEIMQHPCGTVGCISGWANVIRVGDIEQTVRDNFGILIPYRHEGECSCHFCATDWSLPGRRTPQTISRELESVLAKSINSAAWLGLHNRDARTWIFEARFSILGLQCSSEEIIHKLRLITADGHVYHDTDYSAELNHCREWCHHDDFYDEKRWYAAREYDYIQANRRQNNR